MKYAENLNSGYLKMFQLLSSDFAEILMADLDNWIKTVNYSEVNLIFRTKILGKQLSNICYWKYWNWKTVP